MQPFIRSKIYPFQLMVNISYTHRHKHTRAHTHRHTHGHARTRTHTHTHARTRTHTHAHARTHTHTHAHTRTHTHSLPLCGCADLRCSQSLQRLQPLQHALHSLLQSRQRRGDLLAQGVLDPALRPPPLPFAPDGRRVDRGPRVGARPGGPGTWSAAQRG